MFPYTIVSPSEKRASAVFMQIRIFWSNRTLDRRLSLRFFVRRLRCSADNRMVEVG